MYLGENRYIYLHAHMQEVGTEFFLLGLKIEIEEKINLRLSYTSNSTLIKK